MTKSNTFVRLVTSIQDIHAKLALQASKAVNVSLTLRNWLIGWYILAYEQKGSDRAEYGESLLDKLSEKLQDKIEGVSSRSLRLYRQFSAVYPEIWQTLSAKSIFVEGINAIRQTLPAKIGKKSGLLRAEKTKLATDMVQKLSFSHIAELLVLDDETKRFFYQIECIKGGWSVRELKRQIDSFYYERMGLSINKDKLSLMANAKAEKAEPKLSVRDPYIFEFLGLNPKEVMAESRLEGSLLDKLQEFLLEMGHGFCFEAKQKKILIGGTNYFIDLVFYHRVLKCHVLVELKTTAFSHENIGQLNTYVSWYKKNIMEKGDNPPVGILLCANKEHALAEYALAGMANRLFVSKYQLELPKKEEIEKYIQKQIAAGLRK